MDVTSKVHYSPGSLLWKRETSGKMSEESSVTDNIKAA
jgi:hypothetical protein